MPVYAKTTSSIQIGNWTTIQMHATGGNQLGNNLPSDGAGGAGPYLVCEKGVWKYPQQASVGAFVIPTTTRAPVRLISVLADLGASTAWTVVVAGNPSNTTGTPYDAGDAASYLEGTVVVDSGTSQYISKNYNIVANGTTALLFPGQRVYVTSAAGTAPLVRVTLALAYDMK